MQTVAQLDSFVHEDIERARLRPALGSVVRALLGGIAAAGSVVLSEVLRPQVQKEDLHAAEQRVSQALKNGAALDTLPGVYLAMVAEPARALRYRTVDGSDVSKPAGRKFEYLDVVRDSSCKPRHRVGIGGPKEGNSSAPAASSQARNESKRARGQRATSGTNAPAPHAAGGMPPPTDPVMRGEVGELRPSLSDGLEDVAGLPSRRPPLAAILADLKEIKAGRAPKNKLLMGVVAVIALSVLISFVALVISLFRGKPSELPIASGSGSDSAVTSASPPPKSTASTNIPPPAVASATPTKDDPKSATSETTLGDCTMSGEAHVVSPRAFVQSGVEAVPVPGAIALGFAVDPRNGVAVTVDPASIGITTTAKARALGGDARRMSPIVDKGKLTLVPGVDRKIDKLQGRRVVATNPAIDVGVAENALVWAPHDQNSYAKLFSLEGEGTVDAIRAVPLASKGIAVAFRRGNAVYVGAAKGDEALTAEGALSRIAGLGQVGSPAIATSGDTIFVAWSDRASASEPWQVRWTKLTVGGAPADPKQLTMPEGGLGAQAMSPSIAGLGGGRFVMAWSEGTPTHQVRALTLGADGTPSGAPMALSAAGVNAGQPQIAVGPDGRGVVAFLASKGKAYEIHATPVTCASK